MKPIGEQGCPSLDNLLRRPRALNLTENTRGSAYFSILPKAFVLAGSALRSQMTAAAA